MADHANSTPGAVSRRFLFSVAAAVPIAAVTAKSSTASADSASRLATLLLAYRDVGLRLQTLDAELAAAMESVPEWVLPGVGSDGKTCRWAEWPRSELDDLGLPSFMTSRPSLADLQEFNRRSRLAAPQDEIGNRARHRVRVNAWMTSGRSRARGTAAPAWPSCAGSDGRCLPARTPSSGSFWP
jgi:hypothetical protein